MILFIFQIPPGAGWGSNFLNHYGKRMDQLMLLDTLLIWQQVEVIISVLRQYDESAGVHPLGQCAHYIKK